MAITTEQAIATHGAANVYRTAHEHMAGGTRIETLDLPAPTSLRDLWRIMRAAYDAMPAPQQHDEDREARIGIAYATSGGPHATGFRRPIGLPWSGHGGKR